MQYRNSALFTIAVGVTALACPRLALPAESSAGLLTKPFTLSMGSFLLDTKTELSLNGSAGTPGTKVNFKKDLGLQDSDRFRVDAAWRFAGRHQLRALYFDIDNSKTSSLSRSITVGDTVFPVDASVTAENSTTVIALSYEYGFLRRDTYEVGASFGIHAVDFDTAISGQGSVAGQTAGFRRESAVATAPLPVFGLHGLWEFSPMWYLEGGAQYFSLAYDVYDGSVTDLSIALTRMFGQHWGIGAGWNQFTTDLSVDRNRFDGELDWRYSGAQIFVKAAF